MYITEKYKVKYLLNSKLFFKNSIFALVALVLVSCNKAQSEKVDPTAEKVLSKKDSSASKTEKEKEEIVKLVTYHLDSIESKTELDSFKTRFGSEVQTKIFALNRMDAWRLKEGSTIVIPDSVANNFMDFSPFPKEMALLQSIPQAVLISRRVQAIGLYEGGKLVKWGPASTGKKSTQTPVGLFYGNYKSREKISTIDKSWIMPFYFNFMNYEGIGTHEYTLPGYPASHGCVRLRNEDAVFIYNWAKQWELNRNEQTVLQNGTPFMVFGDYNFEAPKPWLDLAKDPESNFLTQKELDTLKSYVTKYQNDPKNFKNSSFPDGEIALPKEGLKGGK